MWLLGLALSGCAAAQYSSSLLPSSPGGALPAGVEAPSISGFSDPVVHPSRGGLAVCVSGNVSHTKMCFSRCILTHAAQISVTASTSKGLKFNFDVPANQSQVAETWLEDVTKGSPFAEQIMGGMQTISGTYGIYGTLCVPANDTKPSGVQLLTHGVGFDRYYWDFAPGFVYIQPLPKPTTHFNEQLFIRRRSNNFWLCDLFL